MDTGAIPSTRHPGNYQLFVIPGRSVHPCALSAFVLPAHQMRAALSGIQFPNMDSGFGYSPPRNDEVLLPLSAAKLFKTAPGFYPVIGGIDIAGFLAGYIHG